MKEKLVKIFSKIGSLMSEEFVNKIFKIGLLFIGIGFLVVYFFHSQNGRFQKIGKAEEWEFLDTRTGVMYHIYPEGLGSVNLTNGEIKIIKTYATELPVAPVAPAPPPGKSAEDFLKGKK